MTTPGKPVFGAGVLRYPQIMSPNFNLADPAASPANSWALLQNGLAYIFGLILSGGTITGPDYVINTSGAFFYSAAPALGNLIVSVTSVAGTDGFGNTYLAGVTVYVPGVPTTAVSLSGGISQLEAANPEGSFTDTLWSIGFNAGGAQLSAPFISTAGSPSTPTEISTDSWNSLGSPGIANVTVDAGRYALMPFGVNGTDMACIDVALSATGAVAAGTYAFANFLPAGYQFPGNYTRSYSAGFNGTITTATNNADLLVDGAGTGAAAGRVRLQIPALPVNTSISVTCFIPLN